MVFRWILILKLAGTLALGAALSGATTSCSTIEGIGKDIAAAGRAGKRVFD